MREGRDEGQRTGVKEKLVGLFGGRWKKRVVSATATSLSFRQPTILSAGHKLTSNKTFQHFPPKPLKRTENESKITLGYLADILCSQLFLYFLGAFKTREAMPREFPIRVGI